MLCKPMSRVFLMCSQHNLVLPVTGPGIDHIPIGYAPMCTGRALWVYVSKPALIRKTRSEGAAVMWRIRRH